MNTLDTLYLALAFAREAIHADSRWQAEVKQEIESAILANGGEIPLDTQGKTNKEVLESYGYKLVTRAEFDAADDVPENLREYRAEQLARPGAFIVYDPDDNEEGWLLVGDDADALAKETVEAILP